MPPPILVAGLDSRSLLLEAPVLQRDQQAVEEVPSARELLETLARNGGHLVVLGPRLHDLSLPETVRQIRSSPATRHVSILALVPKAEPVELDGASLRAGANAVLRRPLDTTRLEAWVAKLLAVPKRVQARVPVQGHVVGTPRSGETGHFLGLTRNLSVNGMLLASPVRLERGPDLDLEFTLPEFTGRLTALGRVVREAPEVAWPYLGYGVEFVFVPPDSIEAIASVVTLEASRQPPESADASRIRSTVRHESWIYEILEPVRHGEGWDVEIHRAPREGWRPGTGGPFYVVEAASPEQALRQAREFLERHG